MKENQQAAVEKSLPGVQARCAVFFAINYNGNIGLNKNLTPSLTLTGGNIIFEI